MIVYADNGGYTETTLDTVETEVDEVDVTCGDAGVDETTVVAVVVVAAQADGGGEVVVDLIGYVHLSTVDVLLALHVGAVCIGVGHHASLCEQGAKGRAQWCQTPLRPLRRCLSDITQRSYPPVYTTPFVSQTWL